MIDSRSTRSHARLLALDTHQVESNVLTKSAPKRKRGHDHSSSTDAGSTFLDQGAPTPSNVSPAMPVLRDKLCNQTTAITRRRRPTASGNASENASENATESASDNAAENATENAKRKLPSSESTVESPSIKLPVGGGKTDRIAKLCWSGVLTSEELSELKSQYGGVIVCPGYTGTWGRRGDTWGKVFIPGAATGHFEARRLLRGWQDKSRSSSFLWWPQVLRESFCKPITVSDVLGGITLERWQEYAALYAKHTINQRQKRCRARRLNRGEQIAMQNTSKEAASSLLNLQGSKLSAGQ
ncbi:unnamed protein product [Sympodiomycopsis kandeliae]